MTDIHPVSADRHRGVKWIGNTKALFARSTTIAYLSAFELTQASLAFPLAFVQRENGWSLGAILGLLANQNLYVDISGNWIARYMPAVLRGYPFIIGVQPNGEAILYIDESSDLLSKNLDGEVIICEDGSLTKRTTQIFQLLVKMSQGEALLNSISNALSECGLLEEWPIEIKADHETQKVSGLYRINESLLNSIDDTTYASLRQNGAIGVAYAQIISMGNIEILGGLLQDRARNEAAERTRSAVTPMVILPEDSSIEWDWSKVGKF